MPIDGILQPSEYDLTKFNTGVTPVIDGSVTNTPDNFIPEQFLRELSADGAPPGWNRVAGPVMEGFNAYITADGQNGAIGTLQKHNFDLIKPEDDEYQFNTPTVSGG